MVENDAKILDIFLKRNELPNLQLGFKITLQKTESKVNKVKEDFTVEAKLGPLSPLSLPLNLDFLASLAFRRTSLRSIVVFFKLMRPFVLKMK